MGVTHGKKRDLQHFPGRDEAHFHVAASMMQTHQTELEGQFPVLQAFPSQLQSEEESSNLIRPLKATSVITTPESHRELNKELRMTHKRRRVSQEGKTELQRVLEKRKWEQRLKASRDQEEAKKKTSQLHQELLKRQQRLENLEKDQKAKQEEPEFIQVKERLRKTAGPDARGKEV